MEVVLIFLQPRQWSGGLFPHFEALKGSFHSEQVMEGQRQPRDSDLPEAGAVVGVCRHSCSTTDKCLADHKPRITCATCVEEENPGALWKILEHCPLKVKN